MGSGKRFVQIQMHHVETHVRRAGHSHDGVQVGAVVIKQTAAVMDNPGNFKNLLFKQTQSVGIGKHESGQVFIRHAFKRLEIDQSPRIGRNLYHLETGHGRAGRIGPVTRVGYHQAGTVLTAGLVPGAHDQQPGEFTLCPRNRLKTDAVHPRYLAKNVLHFPQYLEHSLYHPVRQQGVQTGKTGQTGNILPQPGIVLHSAASERVKPGVDAVVLSR